MNEISLGFSPCPNDTFIFYSLVQNIIDTDRIRYNSIIKDVDILNSMAWGGEIDVTKVSFHAFGFLKDKYLLLSSGCALGRGCGPLVVANTECTIEALRGKKIAIPGTLTTAFLLLQLFDPCFKDNTIPMPFHEIMNAVKKGEVDAGLIIHEGRFAYGNYGLKRVIDLGQWWEQITGLPIPLGGIIAKRNIGNELIIMVNHSIKESVSYAFNHRAETMRYIKRYAQELSDDVIKKHIDLYVNDFTLDIGDEGARAIDTLYKKARERGIF